MFSMSRLDGCHHVLPLLKQLPESTSLRSQLSDRKIHHQNASCEFTPNRPLLHRRKVVHHAHSPHAWGGFWGRSFPVSSLHFPAGAFVTIYVVLELIILVVNLSKWSYWGPMTLYACRVTAIHPALVPVMCRCDEYDPLTVTVHVHIAQSEISREWIKV